MARKFGPTKGELTFRTIVSVCGLLLMIGVIWFRGAPSGPAAIETIALTTVFFGGTLIWSVRKIIRKDYPDET